MLNHLLEFDETPGLNRSNPFLNSLFYYQTAWGAYFYAKKLVELGSTKFPPILVIGSVRRASGVNAVTKLPFETAVNSFLTPEAM